MREEIYGNSMCYFVSDLFVWKMLRHLDRCVIMKMQKADEVVSAFCYYGQRTVKLYMCLCCIVASVTKTVE